MRRFKKLVGADKFIPVIKENFNNPSVIKRNYDLDKTKQIMIKRDAEHSSIHKSINTASRIPNNQKPVFKVNPIWKGETAYIIGGGPSLSGFNWEDLVGKKTIAINKSILHYPNADIIYWTDSRVYGWYKAAIDNAKGLKITIRDHSSYSTDVKILKKNNNFGLCESNDSLCHGNNSGYAAINLAYLLGVTKIVLLGYDMKNSNKQSHYHEGYPVPATADLVYKDQFLPGFNILADSLREKNVKVYNASPDSLLTVWPKLTIKDALCIR